MGVTQHLRMQAFETVIGVGLKRLPAASAAITCSETGNSGALQGAGPSCRNMIDTIWDVDNCSNMHIV